MSLRKKTILVVVLTTIVLMVSVYLLTSKILLSEFIHVEDREVVSNIKRLEDVIDAEIQVLNTKTSDWSRWDDSYRFVTDRNQEFIDSNLGVESMKNLEVNMMVFLDLSGQVVTSQRVDLESDQDENLDLPTDLLPWFESGSLLLEHPDLDSNKSGVIILESGVLLVSSQPIVTSLGEGPIAGYLILGRFLDEGLLSSFSGLIQLDIEVILDEVESVDFGDKPYDILRPNDEVIFGVTKIYDIKNEKYFISKVGFPRTIYQEGVKALKLFASFYVVIGLVFLVVVGFVLEKMIIKRLTVLGGKVDKIRSTRNLDQSVIVEGSDEFARLSRNIDDMLTDLRVAQKMVEERDREIAKEADSIAEKNKTLEHTQRAVLNVLEDLEVEKKKIEETVKLRTLELSEEKSKLEASINSLPVGFAILSPDRKLLLHNSSLNTIFDWGGEDVSIESLKEKLIESFDLDAALTKVRESGDSMSKEELVLGNKFIKLFLSPVVGVRGKVIGHLLLIEDITEHKMLERTREEFFAIASHELRTPLTAIRGNMAMIKDFILPNIDNNPDLIEMINDSYDGSVRLIAIVNDFLDASRLEQGKIVFKKEPIDIGTIIDEVTKDLEGVVLEKKLTLKIEDTPADLPKVLVERDRVKQIIFNLIGNAVHYTREGGIIIKIFKDGNKVKISVTDTGVGISEKNQQRLFKKFQQAQEEVLTRDMTKSTGLGLYISKMLAEGMGGSISLDNSEVGKGSTFSVNLPIAEDQSNKV